MILIHIYDVSIIYILKQKKNPKTQNKNPRKHMVTPAEILLVYF